MLLLMLLAAAAPRVLAAPASKAIRTAPGFRGLGPVTLLDVTGPSDTTMLPKAAAPGCLY